MGDRREAVAPAAIFEGPPGGWGIAKNPGRHAPQRTFATGEIAVSLLLSVGVLVKADRPQRCVMDRWRTKFRRNGLGGGRWRSPILYKPTYQYGSRMTLRSAHSSYDSLSDGTTVLSEPRLSVVADLRISTYCATTELGVIPSKNTRYSLRNPQYSCRRPTGFWEHALRW